MMMNNNMCIIITAFGVFPGIKENMSEVLLSELKGRTQAKNGQYHYLVLPTEWHRGRQALENSCKLHKPKLMIHFGVSAFAEGFVIERRAQNMVNGLADACGNKRMEDFVCANGPDFIYSGLPVEAVAEKLHDAGLKANLSTDAGSYLCNYIYYTAMFEGGEVDFPAVRERNILFVHIPDNLDNMSMKELVTGTELIIDYCAEYVAAG